VIAMTFARITIKHGNEIKQYNIDNQKEFLDAIKAVMQEYWGLPPKKFVENLQEFARDFGKPYGMEKELPVKKADSNGNKQA